MISLFFMFLMRFIFSLWLNPGSPLKRHKPNVDVIYDRRPSMASFNFDCESKDARPVTKADQNIGSADVDFEFHPTRNNLSPIVPVRLSQRFIDEVGFSFFVIYVWGLFLVHLCHGMSFLMERNELFLVYLIGSIFLFLLAGRPSSVFAICV